MTAAPVGGPGPAVPGATPEAPARTAAKQLEAFFLRQFLAEARPESAMLGGGFAGDTFRDMLDSALADSMAAAGGLGLAGTFEGALGGEPAPVRHGHVAAAIPVPTAAPSIASPAAPAAPAAPGEGLLRPAAGRFSSGFGTRVDPIEHTRRLHPGLDIAAPLGAPVSAAAAGRVTHAGPAGTYGNLVTIRHADGTETRYAHLSAVLVQRGDQVAAGATVGQVGSTGRSTGPHLHFEVRKAGHPVDPRPLLAADPPP